ncbi:MAG: DUF2878 domain-containing protein [Planctomycetes bacterium]|nr:DUF2878 domain-containing protein [Planctomycetota bacterium]
MKKLANFLLFQGAWFVTVAGAARGAVWLGPATFAAVVAVHLLLVSERARELRFLLLAGVLGTIADTVLAALGATAYPSSEAAWHLPIVPPWITALWIGFATLPRFSLAWLVRRPGLAALLGAVGGPLSYLAGARLGAVAVSSEPLETWSTLAVEYALATPLLLWLAHGRTFGVLRPPRGVGALPRSGRSSGPG